MKEHLEGHVCVKAALEGRRRRIEVLLLSRSVHTDKFSDVLQLAEERSLPVKRVDPEELDRMTHGKTHGGLVAVCGPKPPDRLEELGPATFLLLLEGIEDARNLGFTLRSAEALGVDAVLLKKHVWDFDEGDVSRASSGAYERLPLIKIEGPELATLRKRGLKLLACIANAKKTIYDVDLAAPLIVAVGGEKRGLSAAVRHLADGFVKIPMSRAATSLSLSHASAVIMAEVTRQRHRK